MLGMPAMATGPTYAQWEDKKMLVKQAYQRITNPLWFDGHYRLSENWDKIRGQIDELGVASELVYPAFATEYRGGGG